MTGMCQLSKLNLTALSILTKYQQSVSFSEQHIVRCDLERMDGHHLFALTETPMSSYMAAKNIAGLYVTYGMTQVVGTT